MTIAVSYWLETFFAKITGTISLPLANGSIDAIRTYDFRLVRAITAFEEALNIPYVDPELIHMHARRLRLIGAALGGKIEWLIRFMEGKRPDGMGEYWNDEWNNNIGCDTIWREKYLFL